jgi:type III pantothenate kinase
MQLVLDVGNTETVVGAVTGRDELQGHWRISTQVPRTADEYAHLLRGLLRDEGFDPATFERAVLGSVVPAATDVLVPTLTRLVPGGVVTVDATSDLPIELAVDEPLTVGADRVVNTLAARVLYGQDTIAVDLGTATTYDCITAEGMFVGGVIAPGVSAGLEWLGRRTAKLPRVEFSAPEVVIGTRTEACIRSGIFYGVVDGIDGMVGRIKTEWGRPDAFVVATGGYSSAVATHAQSVERIEPFLTLFGLAIAGELLKNAS